MQLIDNLDVPVHNSPTDREFRNVAKLRLNSLFAGSSEGAHSTCVLFGIVAACRAVGVSALRCMTWAFERLGTHRDLYDLDVVDAGRVRRRPGVTAGRTWESATAP